mmetsp:Transcript_856/g.1916  ORF Transcript_856/g.1916 Transcript_856/m.1916 type:complete len:443 (+) Transcript_856:50-1378(+)
MLWFLLLAAGLPLALAVLCFLLPGRRRQGSGPVQVAFVHPDLGIGGAERLVVDAAVALQEAGHTVKIFTARHEPHHCFEETKDGTLTVEVFGDFLPRRVLGRFYAACAYLRMCWVALRLVGLQFTSPFDIIIVDQVSICIPLLRLARPCGIIFYCHFPDKLLTGRESFVKKCYRAPLDLMEEVTTGMADVIFVNSRFTAGIFAEAFPLLRSAGFAPEVLYPALNLADQDRALAGAAGLSALKISADEKILLSINRFERKKNVGLAIRALAALPESVRTGVRLVLAGGYDERLPENVEHAAELEQLAKELDVLEQVQQMRSISNPVKAGLLKAATCLLYTPDREHLGIVPLEAMYAQVPVIAVNSGGPLETVVNGETGFHCPQDPASWAEAIAKLVSGEVPLHAMGQAGRARVQEHFSLKAFGKKLDAAVHQLVMPEVSKKRD